MADALMELVGVKVPPDMRKKLQNLAESERRPVSMMARLLMEEALNARAKKAAKKQ